MIDGDYGNRYSDFARSQIVDEETVPAVEYPGHGGDHADKHKDV